MPIAFLAVTTFSGVYVFRALYDTPRVPIPNVSQTTDAIELTSDHDIFNDILIIVLTGTGLFITLFGLGAYKVLGAQIESRVSKEAEKSLRISNSLHRLEIGMAYWELYNNVTEPAKRLYFINLALDQTRWAFTEILRLDEPDEVVEERIVKIRNNWAYFLFEKDRNNQPIGRQQEELALYFADYIEERKHKFPDITSDIDDTIQHVRGRFLKPIRKEPLIERLLRAINILFDS
jgi:hypothetical protein